MTDRAEVSAPPATLMSWPAVSTVGFFSSAIWTTWSAVTGVWAPAGAAASASAQRPAAMPAAKLLTKLLPTVNGRNCSDMPHSLVTVDCPGTIVLPTDAAASKLLVAALEDPSQEGEQDGAGEPGAHDRARHLLPGNHGHA